MHIGELKIRIINRKFENVKWTSAWCGPTPPIGRRE
jgi:hypothetical protein